MIQKGKYYLDEGYIYAKQHPELWLTVVLIVVIPMAFILSGMQFLNAAIDNQEQLEKEKIGITHDLFASVMRVTHFDEQQIQNEVNTVALQNVDITRFTVAREHGAQQNALDVIASLNIGEVGKPVEDTTSFRLANIQPDTSAVVPYAENGERYLRAYRLVKTQSGEDYYIFTETSLAQIDALFASRIAHAYYWLFVLLAIVMLLVFRHVRLIDYARLYSKTLKENQLKDMFTNMIAHELRAPLTAMRGYASMIREREDAPHEVKVSAQRIQDSSERLMLIVNDLLDVARIHSGKLKMVPARTDIQLVISSVLSAMQIVAHEKNITVVQEGAAIPVFITIDEKRFFQALTNLVSNSIKYTEAGEIRVSLEEREDRVELRVKDTGIGISAENQKNLFAPFFRVNAPEVNQTMGTGLGMWITKQLIELMNGSIGVESIKGVGTHIVVTLPKK